MNWLPQQLDAQLIYSATTEANDNTAIKQALEAAARQAIALLDKTINEDSLYLLFSWDQPAQQLKVVVTDASKTRDSDTQVQLSFSQQPRESLNPEDFAEQLHFWLKDFLASYAPFFRYSLVAIFTAGDRTQTRLL